MKKTEFFELYSNRVFTEDINAPEPTDVQFFSPQDSSKVERYKRRGHTIASVFWKWIGEDEVIIDNDTSNTLHKVGFIILKES